MIDLAEHDNGDAPIILRDVAERQQVSKRYLEQLATNLKNAGLVNAIQGRGGGYRLGRAANDIPVLEIVEATIGPVNVVQCVNHPKLCDRSETCPSRKMWALVNGSIRDIFQGVTLADLNGDCLDLAPLTDTAQCNR